MHISDPFRLPLCDPPPFPHRTLTPWGIYTWRSLGKRVTPVMARRQCASCSFYCCDKEQRWSTVSAGHFKEVAFRNLWKPLLLRCRVRVATLCTGQSGAIFLSYFVAMSVCWKRFDQSHWNNNIFFFRKWCSRTVTRNQADQPVWKWEAVRSPYEKKGFPRFPWQRQCTVFPACCVDIQYSHIFKHSQEGDIQRIQLGPEGEKRRESHHDRRCSLSSGSPGPTFDAGPLVNTSVASITTHNAQS